MKKSFRLMAVFAAVAMLGLYAVAGQAGDETAKDPVCGMSVKIAGAPHTAEYLGNTYYFCSAACKTAFLKDPVKFAPKDAAAAPAAPAKKCCGMCCQACCKMMSGMKMMHGQAPVPGAPPAPPTPPTAVAPCAAMPDCPMMKDAPMPSCPMMGHGPMKMKMRMMHGTAPKPGMMFRHMEGGCPMCGGLSGKADIVVENTADGAVVRISSKDPEAVKMIQKHLAEMKAAGDKAKMAGENKEK